MDDDGGLNGQDPLGFGRNGGSKGEVSPLEQEVLDEYTRLRDNMEAVSPSTT